jgi:hypothetical protein
MEKENPCTFDFDEASAAWRSNKKWLGRGMFAYKCSYIHSNGKQCTKSVEGQAYKIPYSIRSDWTTNISSTSYTHCKQHKRSRHIIQHNSD